MVSFNTKLTLNSILKKYRKISISFSSDIQYFIKWPKYPRQNSGMYSISEVVNFVTLYH